MSHDGSLSIPESTNYDNFLNKTADSAASGSLADFFDVPDDDATHPNHWSKHWTGMPEYVQKNKETYKTLYIHFRNAEDYEAFAKVIDQALTEKTKSIWYPALARDANALMRWIEEE